MKFKFINIPSLPRLAWCAILEAGQEEIRVIHGPGVEVHDDWFFEGAWDGPFADAGFVEATNCMGTGARLEDDAAMFVSTSTPFRALVTCKISKQIFISNSLPFVLVQIGDEPNVDRIKYYEKLFHNFKKGFVQEPVPLLMRKGSKVYPHFCCNIQIKQNEIKKFPKPNSGAPSNFEEYRDRLIAMLVQVRENATDAQRIQVYEPLVTLSRGYDSVACAALGVAAGWTKAVTLVPTDLGVGRFGDDGTPVAECLGLEIERFDTKAWELCEDIPEAEFVATAWGGVMLPLAGMKDRLQNTLLIMGHLGDTVWNPESSGICHDFSRPIKKDLVGMGPVSHWEFQLRVGIITVFPPSYAAVHWNKLKQIMTSAEMQPWSIGGDYDRPLPRRIAEEMGVPRELFGQTKFPGAREMVHKTPLRNSMLHYAKFLVKSGLQEPDADGNTHFTLRYINPHFFHWGINRTMERYLIDST